ncbi:MAG TPA: hydrogenase expression/formation protein HypE [Clostridiales bacterium]|nr:hydrogenase expression/formation protein HypE [Clostridiales bacterium]
MPARIQLSHGDGGKKTSALIKEVFYKHFGNELLEKSRDAAIFALGDRKVAFTTDSFVVQPIFFSGGDIGKLAVCGTVNDLAAAGAEPLYLSTSFIIEEGFEIGQLEKIARSMGDICRQVGVSIVAGDTKVVEKGFADGLYINTSGIGVVMESYIPRDLLDGDEIIITGTIAEHGTTILALRHGFQNEHICSDCKPLKKIIEHLGEALCHVKCMTDPTRGGLATVLCEIAEFHNMGMIIEEEKLPIHPHVQTLHQILGTNPMFFASEGRLVLFVEKGQGTKICRLICEIEKDAAIIGTVISDDRKFVRLRTPIGGQRILTILQNEMIPRIC